MFFKAFFNKNISSYDIGKSSEDYVKSYLISNFYNVIATRFKDTNKKGSGLGEIDIIAKKGNTIIFIEVKARNNLENIFYSITQNQQRRIMNSAIMFISKHSEYKSYDIRFDAIFVLIQGKDKKITHIKNAFDASDVNSMIGL